MIAPCSNGHIAQSVNLGRHAGLPWDAILGAEIARAYKPDPRVYQRQRRRARPAAGRGDDGRRPRRRPARRRAACGLRTAFVPRPREYPGAETEAEADLSAPDFEALAEALLGAKPGSLLPSAG